MAGMAGSSIDDTRSTGAPDGTLKLLLVLSDGLEVESVVIPPLPAGGKRAPSARARSTVCVSSQVGCRQGCRFCATGRMGLLRNLSAGEILAQVAAARRAAAGRGLPDVANVVFMGMGEPADNAQNVRAAVACLVDPRRFGFSRDRVSVSTVAPTPDAFADVLGLGTGAGRTGQSCGAGEGDVSIREDGVCIGTSSGTEAPIPRPVPAAAGTCQPPGRRGSPPVDPSPALAWSLHAVDEELRRGLVPTARHSPTALRDGLCAALRARPDPRRRRVVLEVALIAGVNDETRHAEQIADFIAPIEQACFDPRRQSGRSGVLVNLIPYNPTYNQPEGADAAPPDDRLANGIPHFSLFERPSWSRIDAFQDTLRARGVWVSVRASRGDGDASACGQLATNKAVARGRSAERAQAAEAIPE
jgi:23S rRNA (adenine2503-C2)-methyltransferase